MTTTNPTDFQPFPKIPRLSREIILTEKIDGTSGCINIVPKFEAVTALAPRHLWSNGEFAIYAGSRNRWVYRGADNFGFAAWVYDNAEDLLKLGPGRHFGEWFGAGIQRTYGLKEKRFALFNVGRWYDISDRGGLGIYPGQELVPGCCHVVPELYRGEFSTGNIEEILKRLAQGGSVAVPGFLNPEGIVIYHAASGQLFKKTILGDESPKGVSNV